MEYGINNVVIALVIVIGFCIWKFILQPYMNKDEPIEPPEDYKSFSEQMEEAVQVSTDL